MKVLDAAKAIAACIFFLSAETAVAQPDAVRPLLPELPPLMVDLPNGAKLTAFGTIDIGLSYFNNISNRTNTTPIGSIVRAESGVITVSEIGLRGEQPLGGLLGPNSRFVFNLEPGFDVVRLTVFNRNTFFSRSAWAGVSSDVIGTFRYGRQWNFNDDFLNASYYLPGYRLSVFRLTEFGELSDLHDNVFKYLTPKLNGVQFGVYAETRGDEGVKQKARIYEGVARYNKGPFSVTAILDSQFDGAGNLISRMPTFGASYTIGDYRVRGALAFNTLYPGVSPYPGGAGPISVPYKTQVNLYVLGGDWSITPRLTLSADLVCRDNITASNNTQILRLFADFIVNRNIDIYSQIGLEKNHGGAAESFYSTGDSTFTGSGYPNQSQLAFINGFRYKF